MKNHRTNAEITILTVEQEEERNAFDFERHTVHRLTIHGHCDVRVGDVLSNTTDTLTLYAQVYKAVNLSQPNRYGIETNFIYVNLLDDNLEIIEAIEDSKRKPV